MKKRLLFNDRALPVLSLFLLVTFLGCANNQTIELYVAVDGTDTANGSISEPFATIPKAVEAVRELRKKGNANPATIYLREGRHQLNQTLVLGVEDGLPPATESTAAEQYGAGRSKAPAHLTFATRKSE